MIYTVVGTDKDIREKAFATLLSQGQATVHLYSEKIGELEALISAKSLFGEAIVVHLVQTFDMALSRDEVVRLLPDMENSENIFIIDEPFADANRVKKLEKYSKKLYDAREVKEKESDIFYLANLFAKRDKKNTWLEWQRIKEEKSGESIQGALWWKMKTIWEDTLSGRPTKFSQEECEDFASMLVRSTMDAHRGKTDLKLELERIILKL